MTFYGSTTQNKRVFSLNGVEITGTPSADTLTGGFFLPGFSRSDTTATFGEMLVIRGTMTDNARHRAEGYLAHKWGINLDNGHPWRFKSPYKDMGNGAKLTLYWGANDGGEDENAWDHSIDLGMKSSPLAVWFDASDLNADGTIDTNASGDITLWKDKSGNNRHASGGGTAPFLNSTGGPNGKQVIEKRSGEY